MLKVTHFQTPKVMFLEMRKAIRFVYSFRGLSGFVPGA